MRTHLMCLEEAIALGGWDMIGHRVVYHKALALLYQVSHSLPYHTI